MNTSGALLLTGLLFAECMLFKMTPEAWHRGAVQGP